MTKRGGDHMRAADNKDLKTTATDRRDLKTADEDNRGLNITKTKADFVFDLCGT